MKTFKIAVILISVILFNFNIYSQSDLLKKAYKMNSKVLLDEFMYNWERNITPISYDEFNSLSDTIQEVYNVAEVFYKSMVIDSISSEIDTIAIKQDSSGYFEAREFTRQHLKYFYNIKYFIFPLSINFSVNYTKVYSKITDFRPRLYKQGTRLVYLTDDYFNAIKMFVGTRYSEDETESDEEFTKKEQFLGKEIKIVCGGNLEHVELFPECLLTFPLILSIYINDSFLEAQVIYSGGCAVYKADLRKINGKWKCLKNTLISIC
jgi:hypothetical protein